MTKAVASLSRVAYITEVTEGTTPATPAFTTLRSTGESLSIDRSFSYGKELNGLRGDKNYAVNSSAGSGSVDLDIEYGTLDDFLESVLLGAWATNVLTNGTTKKSFTLETKHESGATDIYKRITGASVSELSLSLKAGERVTGKASFVGMTGVFADAIVAGATYAAGNTNPVLVGADFASLAMSGLTLDGIASLDLTFKNTLTQQYLLGSLTPASIGIGQLEITGKISAFVDSTLFNVMTAAQGGTSTGLTFIMGRTAGSKVQFEMPTLVIEAPTANAQSTDGNIMAEFNIRALQDTSTLSGAMVRVTRAI